MYYLFKVHIWRYCNRCVSILEKRLIFKRRCQSELRRLSKKNARKQKGLVFITANSCIVVLLIS